MSFKKKNFKFVINLNSLSKKYIANATYKIITRIIDNKI